MLNVVSELGIHVFLHVLAHIFYKLFAALGQKCEQMLCVSRCDDRILRERHDTIRIDLAKENIIMTVHLEIFVYYSF